MKNAIDPLSQFWPDGCDTFIDLARNANPALTVASLQALAVRLFGTPYCDPEWAPAEGQTESSVLMAETCFVAMLVQAWGDRVQWACSTCKDPHALANYSTAVRVMKSTMRYLPGDIVTIGESAI